MKLTRAQIDVLRRMAEGEVLYSSWSYVWIGDTIVEDHEWAGLVQDGFITRVGPLMATRRKANRYELTPAGKAAVAAAGE